jgi:hypothetical protein
MSLGVGNIGRNNVVSSGGGGGGGGGTVNILLASYDAVTPYIDGVNTAMRTASSGYPTWTFNITSVGGLTTLPTVSVGQYDVILWWNDGALSWNSSFDTVNAAGTGLITGQFYASAAVTGITSTIMPTVNQSGGQASGPVIFPTGQTHPIAIGDGSAGQTVGSFQSSASSAFSASAATTLNSGASTVITGTTGSLPLVVVKNNTAPTGRTVFLNFWPVPGSINSGGWTGDGGKLLLNACLYAARKI